jgi:UBX domain
LLVYDIWYIPIPISIVGAPQKVVEDIRMLTHCFRCKIYLTTMMLSRVSFPALVLLLHVTNPGISVVMAVGASIPKSTHHVVQNERRIGIATLDSMDMTTSVPYWATRSTVLEVIKRGGATNPSNMRQSDDDDDATENIIEMDGTTPSAPPLKEVVLLDGSFKDALEYSKRQGSLLIAFIPQHPISVSSSTSTTATGSSVESATDAKSIDATILSSLTSMKVAQVVQRSPPKSKRNKQVASVSERTTASFVIWYCPNGLSSSEANVVLKRIPGNAIQYKNAAGQKRPILIAVYPHTSSTTGNTVPRLLTQHHCTPPPTDSKLTEWLQTLRIRNKKYYFALQKQLQEHQWEQERKNGYQSSIQSDIELKQREVVAEENRQRIMQQEREHHDRIQQRRIQLLEALLNVTYSATSDKSKSTDVTFDSTSTTTVALRFSDGRTDQRTFTEGATIMDIFYWIDALHNIEYETITLQTMNGKRTFQYNPQEKDQTPNTTSTDISDSSLVMVPIHKAGLGKKIGLRVLIKK